MVIDLGKSTYIWGFNYGEVGALPLLRVRLKRLSFLIVDLALNVISI